MQHFVKKVGEVTLTIALYDREDTYDIRIYNDVGPSCDELWSEDMVPIAATAMFLRLVEHAIKSRTDWFTLGQALKVILRNRLVA